MTPRPVTIHRQPAAPPMYLCRVILLLIKFDPAWKERLGFPGRGQGPAPERWAVGPCPMRGGQRGIFRQEPLPVVGGDISPRLSEQGGVIHGGWVREFLFTVAVSSLVRSSRWLLWGEEFCGPRLFATRALPRATSPTCATGTKPTTFGRCRTTEHAFPLTTRYLLNSDPQLVSLHGCEGQIKTLGFLFFLCVCVCVWVCL